MQTLAPGENFRDSVKRVLMDEAEVVLVIIGKSWLVITGEDGQSHKRLFDDDDHVRQEIEYALSPAPNGRRVIPVLVQNATMPPKDALPISISLLADLNAVRVRPDPDFEDDMRKLRDTLKKQAPDIPFAPPYTYAAPSFPVSGPNVPPPAAYPQAAFPPPPYQAPADHSAYWGTTPAYPNSPNQPSPDSAAPQESGGSGFFDHLRGIFGSRSRTKKGPLK